MISVGMEISRDDEWGGQDTQLVSLQLAGCYDFNELDRLIKKGGGFEVLHHVGPCPVYQVIGPFGPFRPMAMTEAIVTVLAKGANLYGCEWPRYKFGDQLLPLKWVHEGGIRRLVFA